MSTDKRELITAIKKSLENVETQPDNNIVDSRWTEANIEAAFESIRELRSAMTDLLALIEQEQP